MTSDARPSPSLAGGVSEMCQAELEASAGAPALAHEETYFRNIRGKTGALMAACCEVGAITAGSEPARDHP